MSAKPVAKQETTELYDTMKELLGDSATEEELRVLAICIVLPTVNARIDRKINMGNFESLGIGISVNRPIFLPEDLKPVFERLETEALKGASNQAATEINMRVDRIKARANGEGK
jgi:hypothetical protein